MIGRVLGGRYEVLERVGGGGMAIVYRALDTLLNRPVAVKVLRAQFAADDDVVARFRREARAAASLTDPRIVGVYDVGREGDTHYIVMELVDGVTLKQRIQTQGPLSPKAAADVARHILLALEEAHSAGIVHRDIKPQNVIITRDGRVKVTDFGIALAAGGATLVQTDQILGTAHYISPEQARGRPADERSDVYAVGVVLYEMLAGHPPFDGESPLAVAMRHLHDEPTPLTAERPQVPADLAYVVERAMAKEPVRRYGSAALFRADLAAFMQGAPLPSREADIDAGTQPTMVLPLGRGPSIEVGATREDHENVAQGDDDVSDGRPDGTVQEVDIMGRRGRGGGQRGADGTNHGSGGPGRRGGAAGRNGSGKGRRAASAGGGQGSQAGARRHRRGWIWAVVALLVVALGAGGAYGISQWLTVPDVTVPDVTNMPLDKAQAALQADGLTYATGESLFSASVPATYVVEQEPAPHSVVKASHAVVLHLSKGPQYVEGGVPDVTGQLERDAEVALSNAHLVPHVTEQHDDTVPKGHVIQSNPPPGDSVQMGDTVELIVSSGPTPHPFDMPDLVGQTLAQVQSQLDQLGLVADSTKTMKTSYPRDIVAAQTPAPKTQVQDGDKVSLIVSTGCEFTGSFNVTPDQNIYTKPVLVTADVSDVFNGQSETHQEFSQTVNPGDTVTIQACWTGQGATMGIYFDGTLASRVGLH